MEGVAFGEQAFDEAKLVDGRGERLEARVAHARRGVGLEELDLVTNAAEPEGVAVLGEFCHSDPFVLADDVVADQPPGGFGEGAACHLVSAPLREEPVEGKPGYPTV